MYWSAFVCVFVTVVALRTVLYTRRKDREFGYDERQVLVRGRAYKIGFTTSSLLTIIFLVGVWSTEGIEQYAAAFMTLSFFGGLAAFVSYSILKDAFLSFRQRGTYYMLVCLVVVISQFLNFFMQEDWRDIQILLASERIFNLCCGVTFLIVFLLLLGKRIVNRREENN